MTAYLGTAGHSNTPGYRHESRVSESLEDRRNDWSSTLFGCVARSQDAVFAGIGGLEGKRVGECSPAAAAVSWTHIDPTGRTTAIYPPHSRHHGVPSQRRRQTGICISCECVLCDRDRAYGRRAQLSTAQMLTSRCGRGTSYLIAHLQRVADVASDYVEQLPRAHSPIPKASDLTIVQ